MMTSGLVQSERHRALRLLAVIVNEQNRERVMRTLPRRRRSASSLLVAKAGVLFREKFFSEVGRVGTCTLAAIDRIAGTASILSRSSPKGKLQKSLRDAKMKEAEASDLPVVNTRSIG